MGITVVKWEDACCIRRRCSSQNHRSRGDLEGGPLQGHSGESCQPAGRGFASEALSRVVPGEVATGVVVQWWGFVKE
jgi:hypothetical protein